MRFLVVEVTGADSPVTRLSRSLPHAVLDVFLKVPQEGEEPVARAVCQARGGSPEDREALFGAILQVDPLASRMPSPGLVVRAFARFALERATPEMQAVARFAAAHGIWAVWCAIADGVMFLRLMAEGQPDSLADSMRDHLAAAGVGAQTDLEEINDVQTKDNVRDLTDLLERFRGSASAH